MREFPWEQAMEFGFGVLRLSSDQFWKMTPRELQAAFSANTKTVSENQPIGRSQLASLMEKFPDKESENG